MSTNGESILVQPNIGWFFVSEEYNTPNSGGHDKNVASFCRKYGNFGFTFITYPIGGLRRYFWRPVNTQEVPPIHLPDLQLEIRFWQKHVNCILSSWIDPDSTDPWIADLSAEHFEKELEYAKYLGINSILIELKYANSPKLAELIRKNVSSSDSIPAFWILLPTNSAQLGTIETELWVIWRNFRTLCGNSEHLFVGLTFTEDLSDEFNIDDTIHKWHAEPFVAILIDHSLFLSGRTSELTLTSNHSKLLNSLILGRQQHVLISSRNYLLDNEQIKLVIETIQSLLKDNTNLYKEKNTFTEYFDELQAPLQPLTKNLDSSVYHTFEQDMPKYEHYQSAIRLAIADLIDTGFRDITLVVLGAGRGPLVTASINAGKEVKIEGKTFTLKLYAVEKNSNAILSLEYCNEQWWQNSVRIIHSDMRYLASSLSNGLLTKPDIIVSELLGSFGDNELCPECLDGVIDILQDHTICIPQSYKNFLAPIQSLPLYQNVNKNKTEADHKNTDSFYVVCLDKFCYLDEPRQAFEFVHPNWERKSNDRAAELQFRIPPNSELMGFAGQFEAVLYKNIILSTHPMHHTDKLYSWFPALFPMRQLFYLEKETIIKFYISRKLDDAKCWYEWYIKYETDTGEIVTTEVQNINGESQHMKLFG